MSSDSNYGLTDKQILYELGSNLHSNILDILVYGIYTGVYFVALYLTLSRGEKKPRVGSAVLITVMWILATIHVGIRWAFLDFTYVQHGESWEAQLTSVLFYTGFLAQRIVEATVTFASLLLADMTMIWRCWVLYGRRWLIVIPPGLCLVAGSVCYIWRSVLVFTYHGTWRTDQISNFELSYLSTTVFTNLFCTSAIIYRIIDFSGSQWSKSLKTYHKITEILIESAVLYTAIYAIRIGLQVYTQYFDKEIDLRLLYAEALGYSITGIAPTLIIARVAAGFSRPDDSWTRSSMPRMRSTMRSLAESMHFAQPATGTLADNVDLERNGASEGDAEAPVTLRGDSRTESIKLSSDEREKQVLS